MIDLRVLMFCWAAGAALGVVFYGGLWWTLRRGLRSRWPALWFLSSLVVRTGLSLTGFYYVSGGDWHRLLICVLGFAMAGTAATRVTRRSLLEPPQAEGSEPCHAPQP